MARITFLEKRDIGMARPPRKVTKQFGALGSWDKNT
jgi:hypothetical protein